MDCCYHGTVDETLAVLDDGRVVARPGAPGPQVPVAETTAVIPFNDADALDRRLAHRRRGVPAHGAGPDQHRHRAARSGLPRGGPGDPAGRRRAPGHRRDAHALRGPAAPPRLGTRTCWWSASRSAAGSCAAYGMTGRGRRPPLRTHARPRDRRRGRRRHADRQRWRWPGDPRHAVDLPARGGLAVAIPWPSGRRRGGRGDRRRGPIRARPAAGLPRAEYWFCLPPRDSARSGAAVDGARGTVHLRCLNRGRAADASSTTWRSSACTTPRPTSTGTRCLRRGGRRAAGVRPSRRVLSAQGLGRVGASCGTARDAESAGLAPGCPWSPSGRRSLRSPASLVGIPTRRRPSLAALAGLVG